MLRSQIVAALSKEVSARDLAQYMAFHNRRLFRSHCQPKGFSFAIRVPDHFPEGIDSPFVFVYFFYYYSSRSVPVDIWLFLLSDCFFSLTGTLSIEMSGQGQGIDEPLPSIMRYALAKKAFHFNIDATTRLGFYGDRFLHGFVLHQFSGEQGYQLNLVCSEKASFVDLQIARAKNFSSFILMLGNISGTDSFDPQFAIIVQNKDELKIPLSLEMVFKNHIPY